jgi:ribosomal-protein-alanine N-acetyltransferase
MRVLEFIPATRQLLRLLASDPADFAIQQGVHLHEVAQAVAQHSLAFMKSFPLETSPDWFGHLAVEQESQKLAGICSLKGPPVECIVEMVWFTFPGFEGRGIGTAMASFVLERARLLPDVRVAMAHTAPQPGASTRILEKLGLRFAAEELEDGLRVWRWELRIAP